MRTIIMVKLVFCVLQVMILFSCGVCSVINVQYGGFAVDKEGRRFFTHTCTADGEIGDELSWYHNTGDVVDTLLETVKHTGTRSNKMNITVSLTLRKEYNNTRIFCVKRSLRGKPSLIKSDPILVTFTKASASDAEPFVTVTPDTSPAFIDVTATSTFVCTGSKPIDGMKLAWFIQGPGLKPVYAKGQQYDNTTNINNLVLRLNESYNGAVLYCAQSFVTYYYDEQGKPYEKWIESSVTSVRSKNITLRIKEDKNEYRTENKGKDVDNNRNGDEGPEGDPKGEPDVTDASNTEENKEDPKGQSSPLVYAIPIGVIALLLILAAAVWLYRRRRAPVNTPGNHENIYAIPEVQYVTLDLPSATKAASKKINAPTQENPYAEIIGIYRPNNTQKAQ